MGCIKAKISGSACFDIDVQKVEPSVTSAAVSAEKDITANLSMSKDMSADISPIEKHLTAAVSRLDKNIKAAVSLICDIAVRKRARYKVTNGYYKLKDGKYYSVWKR